MNTIILCKGLLIFDKIIATLNTHSGHCGHDFIDRNEAKSNLSIVRQQKTGLYNTNKSV